MERNHQVDQMGIIYGQAKTVLIWPRESDGESARAFELLGTALDHPRDHSCIRSRDLMRRCSDPLE